MAPFVFDINTYVKADTTLLSLNGSNPIRIMPMNAYEDDEAPFVLYWTMPGVASREMFYVRVDYIRYHVLDTDAERGLKIQEAILARLNKGDGIQAQITSSSARALWCVELRSGTGAFNAKLGSPEEREGFYQFQLNFEIGYVPLS